VPTKRVKMDDVAEEEVKYKSLDDMKALTSLTFDPINDSPYERGWPIPFSLVAKSCQDIENTSGKDSQNAIKEILSNVFRTAILLKPDELVPLFYFYIAKLGPEYEALETGIGPEIINQSVAKACGKDLKTIRAELKKTGDIGQVV